MEKVFVCVYIFLFCT